MKRSLLIALLALLPAATSADASLVAPVTNRCQQAVQSAGRWQAAVTTTENRQLAAISSADQQLKNFIAQAEAQGHAVPTIVIDEVALSQRQVKLATQYKSLTAAITATGADCGDTSAAAAASTSLAATRTNISDLSTWYTSRLAPDLATLAGAK